MLVVLMTVLLSSQDARAVLADRSTSFEAKVKALALVEKDRRPGAWRIVAAVLPNKTERLDVYVAKALKRTKAAERALEVVARAPDVGEVEEWLDACRVLRSTKPQKGNADSAVKHADVRVRQEGALVANVIPSLVSADVLAVAVNDQDSTVRDFAVQALRHRLTPELRELLQARLKIEDNIAVKMDLNAALAR